jgi:hypothetical protein
MQLDSDRRRALVRGRTQPSPPSWRIAVQRLAEFACLIGCSLLSVPGALLHAQPTPPSTNLYAIEETVLTQESGSCLPIVTDEFVAWRGGPPNEQCSRDLWLLRRGTGERVRLPNLWPEQLKTDGGQVIVQGRAEGSPVGAPELVVINPHSLDVRRWSLPLSAQLLDASSSGALYRVITPGGKEGWLLDLHTGQSRRVVTVTSSEDFVGRLAGPYLAYQISRGPATLRHLTDGGEWIAPSLDPRSQLAALGSDGTMALLTPDGEDANGVRQWQLGLWSPDHPLRPIARIPNRYRTPFDGDLVVMDGSLVVWTEADFVQGYDRSQERAFVISRSPGPKRQLQVRGRSVVWSDLRTRGFSRGRGLSEIHLAQLSDGPAPLPVADGVPAAVDLYVDFVQPQGVSGQSLSPERVAAAGQAVIGGWIVAQDTRQPPSCWWDPTLRIWKAVDDQPAQVAATTRNYLHFKTTWNAGPTVPVPEVQDPTSTVYFFATVDEVPWRTSIWAHSAEGAILPPTWLEPEGIGGSDQVEARLVQLTTQSADDSHDLAELQAVLLEAGTRRSVPPEFAEEVWLYQALDAELLRPVAVGQRQMIPSDQANYPLWTFSAVDVTATRVPEHTLRFMVRVGNRPPASNVVAFGTDGRSRVPQRQLPANAC